MKNHIDILRREFALRAARNPRYSLRAFGKSLGISHTVLSLVMSGKRPLSAKSREKVLVALELDPKDIEIFRQATRQPRGMALAESYDLISLETFHLISDWIHYAILSLLEIPDAEFCPKWIGKRLGINETQARVAMERLREIGLVHQRDGRWRQTGKPIKVENAVSTSLSRKFQRQLLEKALESLDHDPADLRDFSSMTLAIDPKLVPYAREKIRRFRRKLTAELEAKGNPREVYNLTTQIYPVSKTS